MRARPVFGVKRRFGAFVPLTARRIVSVRLDKLNLWGSSFSAGRLPSSSAWFSPSYTV